MFFIDSLPKTVAEYFRGSSSRIARRFQAKRVHFHAHRFEPIADADQQGHYAERCGPAQHQHLPHATVKRAAVPDDGLRVLRTKPPERKINGWIIQRCENSKNES